MARRPRGRVTSHKSARERAQERAQAGRDRRIKEEKTRATRGGARGRAGPSTRAPATTGGRAVTPRTSPSTVIPPNRDVSTRPVKPGPTIEGRVVPDGGKIFKGTRATAIRNLMGRAFGKLIPGVGLVLTAAELAKYVSERDGDRPVDRSQPAGSPPPSVADSPNNPANRNANTRPDNPARVTPAGSPHPPVVTRPDNSPTKPVGKPTKRPTKPETKPAKPTKRPTKPAPTKPAKPKSGGDLSAALLNKLVKSGVKASELNKMSRAQIRAMAKRKGISG